MSALPPGFAMLEPFVETWAGADFQARFDCRYMQDMASIQAFYDAMLPHADAAMDALAAQPLDDLSGEWLTLYRLLMAFPHASFPVERYKQPRAANTCYPAAVRVVRGPVPA